MDKAVAAAPELNLGAINPMIEDNFADTRGLVVPALRFISIAISAIGDSMTKENASGCSMLIDACIAALEATK